MSHRPGLLDVNHPFFRPLWRRVVTVALPLVWAAFELATGSVGWAILFGAAGFYAGYQFFVLGSGVGEGSQASAPDPAKDESDG